MKKNTLFTVGDLGTVGRLSCSCCFLPAFPSQKTNY